jgi:phosphoribosylglycinamide formyltransferase-1
MARIGKNVAKNHLTDVASRMQQIAVFASGTGSNTARIIDHFRHHASIRVALVVCNKSGAGVLEIAAREGVPTLIIEKEPFFRGDAYVGELRARQIGFIVLAGFLWKIPAALIKAYPGKIINIHPALLPKFGGKGMYGRFVHEAVVAAAEKETGITIHYVDEQYDHGQPIFQAKVVVEKDDTPESVAKKVHRLEYEYFAQIIEDEVQKHR